MDRRERSRDEIESQRTAQQGVQSQIWTIMPGIILAYNPTDMTATVQPSIKMRRRTREGKFEWDTLPKLIFCPVVFPSGGGFTMTFDIDPGDECLIHFAMRNIDAWWQSGGVQQQIMMRMHDISDGFVQVGPRSKPRALSPVVTTLSAPLDGVMLRSDDGQAVINIARNKNIKIVTPGNIELHATGTVIITGDAGVELHGPTIKEN
jgi:hypothetical protein